MSVSQFPDDPTEFMAAMGPIMVVNTTVAPASVFVEQGVNHETAQFPVLLLSCPQTDQVIEGISGFYQATFKVHGLYLDKWVQSARTFEQCQADARAALYQMARNLRATPDLGMTWQVGSGVSGGMVQANNHITLHTSNKPDSSAGLGFPLIAADIEIAVIGPVYR